jgi:hypothetical protein
MPDGRDRASATGVDEDGDGEVGADDDARVLRGGSAGWRRRLRPGAGHPPVRLRDDRPILPRHRAPSVARLRASSPRRAAAAR